MLKEQIFCHWWLTIHLYGDSSCLGVVDIIVFGHAGDLLVVHVSVQPENPRYISGNMEPPEPPVFTCMAVHSGKFNCNEK